MAGYERFVFMKVGQHAGEDFDEILQRKRQELRTAGRIFWGYGGSSCHPFTQIQPFARETIAIGGRIHLVMEAIDSKADPDLVPASEFSDDGVNWKPIPNGIVVTGSRYALVLGDIRAEDFEFPLHEYAVALGKSEGKPANEYLRGRLDKACLMPRGPHPAGNGGAITRVSYVAEMVAPFAVLLRGERE